MKAIKEMLSRFKVVKHHLIIPDNDSDKFITAVDYYDLLSNLNTMQTSNNQRMQMLYHLWKSLSEYSTILF